MMCKQENSLKLLDKDQKLIAKFHPYFYIQKYKIPGTLHVVKALSSKLFFPVHSIE